MNEQQLKNLYYDPDAGYQGLTKFYRKVKEVNPNVTLSDVKAWLNRQYTFQINRQGIRPTYYRTILANKPKDNYQMDILVYDRYADQGYKHILCCIDVYSRYAMCLPLKSRKVENTDILDDEGILASIKKIFNTMGKPRNLNTDNEFFLPKVIQRYFADNNIKHHVSQVNEINKQAIVERWNRTLAKLLQRWRVATGRTDWHTVLPELVQNYNKTYQRTIKERPIDVWEGRKPSRQTDIHQFESELNIGDLVRVKQIKGIFDKADALQYSPEEYVIVDKKDGIENGIKLKKFKLKNIATNQILTDPRVYFKDYELKAVQSIVQKIDTETDLAEKAKTALESHNLELEQELEKEREKVKELENVVPYTEPPKTKEVKRFTKDQKKLEKEERDLAEIKDIKPNTTIQQRQKELDRFSVDTVRRYATYLGLGKITHESKVYERNINGKVVKRKKQVDKPTKFIKEQIVREEKARQWIV